MLYLYRDDDTDFTRAIADDAHDQHDRYREQDASGQPEAGKYRMAGKCRQLVEAGCGDISPRLFKNCRLIRIEFRIELPEIIFGFTPAY